MNPFRILVLAGLFYLLYRLLVGKRGAVRDEQATGSRHETVDDTLVEDPVCHTYIPLKEAKTLQVKGRTHHFCSSECRQKFQEKKEVGE